MPGPTSQSTPAHAQSDSLTPWLRRRGVFVPPKSPPSSPGAHPLAHRLHFPPSAGLRASGTQVPVPAQRSPSPAPLHLLLSSLSPRKPPGH